MLALTSALPLAHAGHLTVVLQAKLSGSHEVPPDNSPKPGKAKAVVFGIDDDPLTLCYALTNIKRVAELDQAPGNGRAAHVHEAPFGSNGPVVAVLAWPQNGQAGDCLTEGETGKFPTNEAGIVQRILNNPASFYINIHNSQFPAGAVRGQLGNSAAEQD